jgi:hypothetical protein
VGAEAGDYVGIMVGAGPAFGDEGVMGKAEFGCGF